MAYPLGTLVHVISFGDFELVVISWFSLGCISDSLGRITRFAYQQVFFRVSSFSLN